MKKLIALSTLLTLSSFAVAQGGYQDPAHPAQGKPHHEMKHKDKHQGFFDESKAVKTVAALKEAEDDTPVMLEGKIIRQIDNDEFIFQDATGEVEIDVSKKAWRGQEITPNDTVQLRGKVDKEWGKTEVDVKQVLKK